MKLNNNLIFLLGQGRFQLAIFEIVIFFQKKKLKFSFRNLYLYLAIDFGKNNSVTKIINSIDLDYQPSMYKYEKNISKHFFSNEPLFPMILVANPNELFLKKYIYPAKKFHIWSDDIQNVFLLSSLNC